MTGDILCFLPGAAEIRRVQRALEEADLERQRAGPAAVWRARRCGAGCGTAPGARRAAQDRARHQHCRDQPDHRRRSRRRRFGIAPLCGVRSGDRHEPAGDHQGVAGRGGSAPRTRRPIERGPLLPAMVGGHAGVARAADGAGNPARGSRAAGAGAQPAGAPSMPRAWPGWIRRPRHRWRRHAICCGSSRPSMPRRASHRMAESLAKLGTHPRLAHMLVKAREHGAPRLACDLAAILSERDILRAAAGARDVDLRLRVAVLRGDRAGPAAGHHGGRSRHDRRRSAAPALAARLRARRPRFGGSRMSRPESCWRGPIRIASAGRAAMAAGICWRMAAARASRNRRRCQSRNSSSRPNWTARNARRGYFSPLPWHSRT